MNEHKSWDSSLVKKFSSSNHYKLLNQLRSEVKKYPLNYKKNKSTNLINEYKSDNKISQIQNNIEDTHKSINNNINSDIKSLPSTVSFNNSKNFSIYNNPINDSTINQKESNHRDQSTNLQVPYISTFKDRLNQIDMK
tara:strand:- start:154 stop:567 length:414 start_codon:yes stop_codon:yes gene_type:complete